MGDVIFFIILALVLIGSLLFIFKDQVKNFKYGLFKNYNIKKVLKRIAEDHDYLYLPNVTLRVNPQNNTQIDNILMTNKNIYVIKNVFWNGILNGQEKDDKWFLQTNKNLQNVDNPLNINHLRIKILSKNIDVPLERFKNVVLYGDSLDEYRLELENKDSIFCNYRKFEKKLLEIEKNSLESFSDEEAEQIMQLINDKSKASYSRRKE